jgi:50S ribosomal protein L16 3-hydroxylase
MKKSLFGDIGVERFLQEYWQQKPLLVRQAIPEFHCPISPEELAGLALEEEIVSRLVREKGHGSAWQVEHGPFAEETFLSLPEQHWTLLVQEVDRHLPEIADLLHYFDFLPRWRIDDIMISYAADQGSVGPHLDQYDVFLLQGLGQRRWQLDQQGQNRQLQEGLELAILEQFDATDDWLLQPGDMLYLPAGIPHHGVAQGPCMTLSIGCRAPDSRELLEGVLEQALLDPDYPLPRYRDLHNPNTGRPGELNDEMRRELRQLLLQPLLDNKRLDQLLSRYLTQASRVQMHIFPDQALSQAQFIQQWRQSPLAVPAHLRALYYHDDAVHVVIDGIDHRLPTSVLTAVEQLLNQGRLLHQDELEKENALLDFLNYAYQEGQLEFIDG